MSKEQTPGGATGKSEPTVDDDDQEFEQPEDAEPVEPIGGDADELETDPIDEEGEAKEGDE